MSKIISPIQTIEELKFVKKNSVGSDLIPLNLATFLYCKKHNISYIDPITYSSNDLHIEIIRKTDSILGEIKIPNHKIAFVKEFIAVCRFYLHQIFFIEFILKKAIEKNPEVDFLVSGFKGGWKSLYSDKNYVITDIAIGLFPEKTNQIFFEENDSDVRLSNNFKITKRHDVDLLIPSLGYNFNKLSFAANMLGLRVGVLYFENASLKQKISYMAHRIKPVEITTSLTPLKTPNFISWLEGVPGIEGELLRKHITKVLPFLNREFGKCMAVNNTVELLKPKLTASFATRGFLGAILESDNWPTNSVCIPHGTVTAKQTDQDRSYRSTIAEAVFTGQTKWLALQSKIAAKAYHEFKPEGEGFLSGNLIFNESENRAPFNKGIILYATTQKDFYGMQFYGVETYYEFYSNLKKLELISSKICLPIFVKLHPSARGLQGMLKEDFPSLKIVTSDLAKLLSISLVTISFSSSVIEDSLYSEVPVILFDPWLRYQHCEAEFKVEKKNKAIYYVSKLEDLIMTINTIKESNFFEFEEYIIKGKSKKNFKKLFEKLL
jgi:hypothetical protein